MPFRKRFLGSLRMNATLAEFHILLIEDSRADAKIIERALREGNVSHRLTVIPNGRDALAYLFGLGDDTRQDDEPDLILLDLNLPGIDGCQVLTQIKSDPYLRMIPVVILTTSHREEDIVQTYAAGANSYIPKPAEYPSYCELVASLHNYWVNTVLKIPRHLKVNRMKEAAGS
jgi:chemotaxis family two-component system response regulator Rcp1